MKRMIVVTALMVLAGGRALAEPTAPQAGNRPGPPPEAYTACEGKTEGSSAQLTGRDGETVTGTCRMADGKLVLRPDRAKGNAQDERRGPPPEAYKACEGKSNGSTSQFVNPRGETVKGKCEEENGKMVLRPDDRKGGRQVQVNDGAGEGRGAR